ncbi:MAG: hypothetical protein HZB22_08265 [Deltaproteobacteria bacterium]|nr:hypothetical protein [Deltaproteobacteria bacterium]
MRHQKVKQFLAFLAILFFALSAVPATAGEFGDLKAKILEARDSLVMMLKNKDKRGADQQKLVKDTADAVSAKLARMKAPAGNDAKFKELVDTWGAFKKTRETDLVPMILGGKQDDAEKLAGGIQKERFQKIIGLVDELGK